MVNESMSAKWEEMFGVKEEVVVEESGGEERSVETENTAKEVCGVKKPAVKIS